MTISLTANAGAAGQAFPHHWNLCVGAGRANEALRAGWLEQLKLAREHCGFRYVRFHGLFHDDMFVYREVDGRRIFNFQYVDEVFDRMLALGVRPFVELGFCPGDLASERGTVFWWKGNGSPPKDYGIWEELVGRLTRHLVERYGIEEVATWYFEVWNEPNLDPFFRGSRSQYFELYRVSVRAVKAVDARLRVGGPATSNFVPDARFDGEREDTSQHRVVTQARDLDALEWKPVWLEAFFQFCAREKLPVDFISVHPYPTDWALDEHGTGMKLTRGVDATPKDLALVRRLVAASPFPTAEIHLTEWNSSSSPRDHMHDHLPAATYVVKANVESVGHVESLAYWTFTDVFEEGGAGDSAFHGGFGMINYQGIVKPTFHAYRFLAALGDERIAAAPGVVVTRQRATGRLSALVYHYPAEMTQTVPGSFDGREKARDVQASGSPAAIKVALTGLRPGAAFALETLDGESGDAMSAWRGLGEPDPLTRAQTEWLRRTAWATRQESLSAGADGTLVIERTVPAWTVLLLREI